jgi:NAD(P)H dehydrogenase (quinone)
MALTTRSAIDPASVTELVESDAIIVGATTRFGRMPAQMATFLD